MFSYDNTPSAIFQHTKSIQGSVSISDLFLHIKIINEQRFFHQTIQIRKILLLINKTDMIKNTFTMKDGMNCHRKRILVKHELLIRIHTLKDPRRSFCIHKD